MSAVLNDRDAILQAAATRIVNPKNADIMLTQSASGFHVNAAGAADVASITVSATLVGLEGAVSWSVQGATLSNVTDREATVTYANMQGSTAIVSASIMSSGERFAKSVVLATIQDGAPGSSAKTVKLTPSEQVFKISKAGANSPVSITLTATGQNTAGTPSFTIPVGTATLTAGSSSAQKVLTFANMATDQVTVEVTLDGQKDRVTIYKVREGQDGQPGADGVVGLLNNESVNLPATDAGVVTSVAGAVCTMKVYRGAADDSANWTYAYSPASVAGGLQYTTSGGTLTVTGLAAGVDSAFVDITASRTGYASITKRFSVAKAKSGAGGTPGVDARNLTLVASSQVVQVAKNGTASPASVTLTSTAQNLAGTPTFAITSGTATLTGAGSARSFTYASMTSDSVTVRVTQDGLTDTVTIVKLREGADGAAAITGMLSNEIVTLPASSAGVVSSFSGAVCSMKVYNGTADDTANWGFAYAPASSTGSLQYTTTTSGTVTVTGMNNGVDSAYVDITASRTGYAAITKRFTVTKSKAGASVTGARGAGQYYVVGSAWSDVVAQAACPGGPVINDQVNISNGTVTYTKRWDGAAWNVPGAYLSDELFVEKGIRASKVDTNGLIVRAPDGTVLLDMGGLRKGYEAPGTKNSEQQWVDVQGIPYESILNNDDSVAMGFNPTFADWPSGQARPTGWSGSSPVRETAIRRLGQWAIRFNTPGGTQIGMNRRVALPTPLPLGTFIAGTYDVYVARIDPTNTTGKPGLMVRLWWGTANGEYTDRHFPASQTTGGWQRINFTARPAAGKQILQVEFYLFGSFSNLAYGGHFFGDVVFDNFRFALFDNSLDNTAISLAENGSLSGAGGGQVTITGLGYTGALDATKGAPAGTTVGGTLAETVASNAAAGKSASDALPGINSSLAGKLAAAGNQNLTGPVALTSSGAIVVGTVNDGVRINTTGLIGRKAGYTTFSIAADGTALFGGTLAAATGTLGKLQVLDTLYGGDYTGWGWPTDPTKGGFAISFLGAIFGNYNSNKYIDIRSSGEMFMPGFSHAGGQLTLDNTIIINPQFDSFTSSLSAGGMSSSGANGSRTIGSRVLSTSGGKAPLSATSWVMTVKNDGGGNFLTLSGDGTDTVTISGTGNNVSMTAIVTGTKIDANGRITKSTFSVTAIFGTPA